jgi:hypothetical protein
MLTYLFLITIVYEFFGLIRSIYKYRTRHLTDKEKGETTFALTIVIEIMMSMMALVGILFSGAIPVVFGIAFAIFAAFGACAYTFYYAKGINIALFFAIYNYIMMMLFVWSVCKAI